MPAKTKTRAATKAPAAEAPQTVLAIKGFDENLACRGFSYAVGQTYTHEGDVVACQSGFHAIEGHPLEVFSYYAPANNRFCLVECGGEIVRETNMNDSKIACAEITIKAEIRLPDLIERAVKYVLDRVTWVNGSFTELERSGVKSDKDGGAATASGYWGAATASGYWGAATASGYQGAATASGDRGAATASGPGGAATASGPGGAATASGRWGAATASGDRGAATASGDRGAATASGDWGAATASGDWGAATASGYQGAATASGDWGAATASGDWGAATASGYRGAATAAGVASTAHTSGIDGKARGIEGAALHLDERDSEGTIIAVWAGIVGRNGIKPMTWYALKNGEPTEIDG
ncbi:DUF7666 domain-containing protein [Pelagibacterium lentulum]|uniref:DUF7666 domain-containing protein n=1 Tax=Pelagibacterium lentulum TaxID=2029865 RepID=A0A916W3U4_9HYPH|nr:hypothetical protein [Pelagibacterium lentulum]GGA63688.1 hypothetical protein GCM10011499_37550 [Pelagibacterium lentulum]